jgi:hypothetical protein
MAVRAIVRSRTALVAAAGWAGVVAGHLGGYLLAIPGGERRARYLEATGHGSFGTLVAAAAVAGAIALLCAALSGRAARSRVGLVPTTLALAAVQMPGFLVLEAAERGFSPAAALSDPAVVLGLAVQALVAVGSALLLRGVQVVAGKLSLGRSERPAPAPADPSLRPPRVVASRRSCILLDAPLRAPPGAAAA